MAVIDPIRPDHGLRPELQRLARDRVSAALDSLNGSESDAIHEVRKRCKELRALFDLAGSGPSPHVAKAARSLSSLRDLEIIGPTLHALGEVEGNAVGQPPAEQRNAALHRAKRHLRRAGRQLETWRPPNRLERLIPAFESTYRQGRRRLEGAIEHPTEDHVHALRKPVKRLRHQLEFLQAGNPELLQPTIELAERLGDRLGEHHDLAVTTQYLSGIGRSEAVIGSAHRRQQQLTEESLELARMLYVETPVSFSSRIAGYWAIRLS